MVSDVGYLERFVITVINTKLPFLSTLRSTCFRERLAAEKEMLVDIGSDQTSLHNPYNGGYYPVGLSFEEANELMASNSEKFKEAVKER